MSIITTVEAVPSRLFAIYSTLFDNKNGVVKERIQAWATPPSLSKSSSEEGGGSSTKLFVNSLQEARRLGLVEEEAGRLRLTVDARGGGRRGHDSESHFRNYLARTLFVPTCATETRQTGFMYALAWFLSTNPLKPMKFSEDPSFAIKRKIGENAKMTECTTLLNFQSFLYWARYLGFATFIDIANSRRAIPDPMRAIEAVLPTVFASDMELATEEFLTRLTEIYPVFEKGNIRESYYEMLLYPLPDAASRLSIATSIALQRLADRRKIALISKADAPARILNFGVRESRVSHVRSRGTT